MTNISKNIKPMKVNKVFKTGGDGLWSIAKKNVRVTNIVLEKYDELLVFFDTKTWNVDELDLIYTDKTFLRSFKEWLAQRLNMPVESIDLDYSEHGMQGRNFISMDFSGEGVHEMQKMIYERNAYLKGMRTAVRIAERERGRKPQYSGPYCGADDVVVMLRKFLKQKENKKA